MANDKLIRKVDLNSMEQFSIEEFHIMELEDRLEFLVFNVLSDPEQTVNNCPCPVTNNCNC